MYDPEISQNKNEQEKQGGSKEKNLDEKFEEAGKKLEGFKQYCERGMRNLNGRVYLPAYDCLEDLKGTMDLFLMGEEISQDKGETSTTRRKVKEFTVYLSKEIERITSIVVDEDLYNINEGVASLLAKQYAEALRNIPWYTIPSEKREEIKRKAGETFSELRREEENTNFGAYGHSLNDRTHISAIMRDITYFETILDETVNPSEYKPDSRGVLRSISPDRKKVIMKNIIKRFGDSPMSNPV